MWVGEREWERAEEREKKTERKADKDHPRRRGEGEGERRGEREDDERVQAAQRKRDSNCGRVQWSEQTWHRHERRRGGGEVWASISHEANVGLKGKDLSEHGVRVSRRVGES